MRKQRGLSIFAGVVFAFLFIPLIIITITAFGEKSTIQFPITGFTFGWLLRFLKTNPLWTAFY